MPLAHHENLVAPSFFAQDEPSQRLRGAVNKTPGLGIERKPDQPDGTAIGAVRLRIALVAYPRKGRIDRN